MRTIKINRTLTLQYLCRRTRALAVIVALTVGLLCHVLPASAQIVDFVIEYPDGGDCEFLGGEWSGRTCTVGSPGNGVLKANERLFIRNATVVLFGQLLNYGTIFVGANDTADHASLEITETGTLFNFNVLGIIVGPPCSHSPGISNKGTLQNFGSIVNQCGGIFNNFGILYNRNNGDTPGGFFINFGFFHNSGPPVSPAPAQVHFLGDGFLTNTGVIENFGFFNGPLEGICIGICE